MAHLHPSQDITPSSEDIDNTNCLVDAGTVIGIGVIDHMIVNAFGQYTSMAEEALGSLLHFLIVTQYSDGIIWESSLTFFQKKYSSKLSRITISKVRLQSQSLRSSLISHCKLCFPLQNTDRK